MSEKPIRQRTVNENPACIIMKTTIDDDNDNDYYYNYYMSWSS